MVGTLGIGTVPREHGKKLREIRVYRSCKVAGSKISYTQQLRYLVKKDDKRDPMDILMEDLGL